MQVCTLLQTDNHVSTPPLSFFTGRMPFLPPNQQCQSRIQCPEEDSVPRYLQFGLPRSANFSLPVQLSAAHTSCLADTPQQQNSKTLLTYLRTHSLKNDYYVRWSRNDCCSRWIWVSHTASHTPTPPPLVLPLNGKGSPYSITERRVPELIPVLGSQPAGDVSYKPGGRLTLLSARPAVTPATLKRAATYFAAWWTEARRV